MKSRENLFVSLSGGLTSAFMLYYIINNESYKKYNIVVVFANTGKEREETLYFVNQISKEWGVKIYWIEYCPLDRHGFKNWFKLVDYKSACRDGKPFEKFIKKEGIPNINNKGCSSRLKELPMHNFVYIYFASQFALDNGIITKEEYYSLYELLKTNDESNLLIAKGIIKSFGYSKDYFTAIGIRYDESHRIKWDSAKKNRFIYPLSTDFPVSKEYVHSFWESQSFTLKLKSYQGNCDCCWKKSDRKLYTIAKEDSSYFKWWANMEKKYNDVFYRKYRSANQIVEESNNFPKSKFAKCDTIISKLKKTQGSLFDNDLDNGMNCSCQ